MLAFWISPSSRPPWRLMSTTEKTTPRSEVSSLPRSASIDLIASNHMLRRPPLPRAPPSRRPGSPRSRADFLPARGAAEALHVGQEGVERPAFGLRRPPPEVLEPGGRPSGRPQDRVGQRLAEDLPAHL